MLVTKEQFQEMASLVKSINNIDDAIKTINRKPKSGVIDINGHAIDVSASVITYALMEQKRSYLKQLKQLGIDYEVETI